MTSRARMTRIVMMLGVAVVIGACAKVPTQTQSMEAAGIAMSGRELRTRNVDLSRHVAAVIEAAADSMRAVSTDATVRANALRWKTYVIPQVREAGLRPDPLVGALDLSALLAQLEQYFTSGNGQTLFGDQQSVAVEAIRSLRGEVLQLSRAVAGGQGSIEQTWRERVEEWAADHPIRNGQYTRPTPIADIRILAADAGGGIGVVAASMENELRLLQERLAFAQDYGARELAWRTALGIEESVGAETMDSLRAIVTHTAALMGGLTDLLASERAAVIEALGAERVAVAREILLHRQVVLAALAGEREAMVAAVGMERGIVLDAVAAERAAVLAGADSIVQRGFAETRSLVNHVMLVMVLTGAAAIVLAGAAAFVVVRFARPPG
jgi:hypothetical protein